VSRHIKIPVLERVVD